jgi:hypothetical protein
MGGEPIESIITDSMPQKDNPENVSEPYGEREESEPKVKIRVKLPDGNEMDIQHQVNTKFSTHTEMRSSCKSF